MKKFLLQTFFLVTLFPAFLSAQTVKVLDSASLQPIQNAYIYSSAKTKMVSTNAKGLASLEKFTRNDTLNFQHPSYRLLSLTYDEVENLDFEIKLTERAVEMAEVYVSASKREQDQSEIPRKITQIGQEEITLSNSQTTADLLESSGKVFVQKSQLGGGSPMIRGFAANSVLIAVDGIRMNTAIFRSGNLQNVISIDANSLEQTEVIFGPGSVIYGSDALGGVMNFQTKEPELSFSEDGALTSVNALSRYSSANNERTVHADLNLGYENWGFLTSVTYSYYDDLRSGGDFYDEYPDFGKRFEYQVRRNGIDTTVQNNDVTDQKISGYEQLNLMQKIRYKPTGKLNMNYGIHYGTTSDIPRYDRLILRQNGDTGPFENAGWHYGPQIWMMNALEVELFQPTGLYDKATGTFSYQWFQESRNDRKYNSTELRNREENVDMYSANIDFDKHWGAGKELFYGLEGVYNYVSSKAHSVNIETGQRMPEATRYPDGGSDHIQLAAYAKYRQDLSDKITAVAGARYSHIILESRFDSDLFFNFPFEEIDINTGSFNGSLGFTYRPVDDLQFNLNASSGFRAPNVDDAAKVFDSEPGSVVVPNEDIEPEKSYNLDFAVIKNFSDLARLEVNAYYTWLRDAMVRRDHTFAGQDSIVFDNELSRVQAVVNAGKAYIWGFSAAFSAELTDHLGFESNVTYTEGKDITKDIPMRHIAPFFGRVGLTYKVDKLIAEFYSEFNAKKPIEDFSPSERNKPHLYTEDGTPGWFTLNTKASYQINEYLQLNAGIENILDKHYRPYSSGISAPGRNLMVAIRATL